MDVHHLGVVMKNIIEMKDFWKMKIGYLRLIFSEIHLPIVYLRQTSLSSSWSSQLDMLNMMATCSCSVSMPMIVPSLRTQSSTIFESSEWDTTRGTRIWLPTYITFTIEFIIWKYCLYFSTLIHSGLNRQNECRVIPTNTHDWPGHTARNWSNLLSNFLSIFFLL